MEVLRALYESIGLRGAQTLLQSGNVVFRTEQRDLIALAKQIESASERKLGFHSDVVLRTSTELRDVVARNPFAKRAGVDASKLLVSFLVSDPGAEARGNVLRIKCEPEELRIDGREVYIYFPNGMARPKLSMALVERTLRTSWTGRNWNTVRRLMEMAEELEAWFERRNYFKETTMAKNGGTQAKGRENEALQTPTDLGRKGVEEITGELRKLLADTFALYLKTKNFHWHMSGKHFRDYHLLLDEHGDQIFAMTDDIAERARKIGGTTIHSISEISKYQRLKDNNEEFVAPLDMLAELSADNQALTRFFRAAHEVCEKNNDVATTSLIEVWIDQTERRTWFLAEIVSGLHAEQKPLSKAAGAS
jgi:starvation-inducible DNA-binding protein